MDDYIKAGIEALIAKREALVSEREAMLADNKRREEINDSSQYNSYRQEEFQKNADELKSIALAIEAAIRN